MKNNNKINGKVILVGAGPGDPDLITVKGVNALRRADVVIYDYLANDKLLAKCRAEAEKIYVGKKGGEHTLSQDQINRLLIDKAKTTSVVVRLKGGDPLIFGRGGEELLALKENNISFEVIPGVTAGTAALAYAGIPATHRAEATSVSFITGHEDPNKPESGLNWKAIARMNGTLVFYMGVKNLPTIVARLCKNGKLPTTPAAVIHWGTLPGQRTVQGTLANIEVRVQQENIKPPALIIVGEVVNYRNAMNWFEHLPLFGRRVVITRARAQSSELVRELESLGAEVIEFPTIKIIPPQSWQALDRAITDIAKYDWIVFTSVNGVEMFQQRLNHYDRDVRKLAKTKIAAIGPATAERLRLIGVRADLIPEKFVAEELAALIRKQGTLKGQRFLLPRADLARSLLKDELEKSGAIVDEIVAYRTTLAAADKDKVLHELNNRKIDAITFTSSSTVSNFVDMVGKDQLNCLDDVVVACIGPITQNTAEQLGIDATITAQEYTIPALVDEIVSYFQSINLEGKS